jgi:hypothetical protein
MTLLTDPVTPADYRAEAVKIALQSAGLVIGKLAPSGKIGTW